MAPAHSGAHGARKVTKELGQAWSESAFDLADKERLMDRLHRWVKLPGTGLFLSRICRCLGRNISAGAGAILSTQPFNDSINAEEDLGEPWGSFHVVGEVVHNILPIRVGHRLQVRVPPEFRH